MKILSSRRTAEVLPYRELAEYLREMLVAKREGRAVAPPRLSMPLTGGGVLLVMPAADDEIAITKLVTVHSENAAVGLPSLQAEVLVFEARTGRRLLWLDGATVTASRTAALSMLAARMLAPETGGPLLIVGAGVQGRAHLEAFVEGLGVKQVYVVSRDAAHAESLAEYGRSLGVEAKQVGRVEEVLDEVRLIVTATTSPEPVLTAGVRADAFVAAVGAYQPEHAELPPELVRSARVYVDTLEGTRAGAGDLIRAGVDWGRVTALEDVVGRSGESGTGPVVFKSVGHALWDLAAARLAWRGLAESEE